jgi:putative transposase
MRRHTCRRPRECFAALDLLRRTVAARFCQFGSVFATDLAFRHEPTSACLSETFQSERALFGITSSPALMRELEGNDCAEHIVRALEANLLLVQTFATIEELRRAPLVI